MDRGGRPPWVREVTTLGAEMVAAYVVAVVVAWLFDWGSPWLAGLIGPVGVLGGLVFGLVARRRK